MPAVSWRPQGAIPSENPPSMPCKNPPWSTARTVGNRWFPNRGADEPKAREHALWGLGGFKFGAWKSRRLMSVQPGVERQRHPWNTETQIPQVAARSKCV
jgi:hypothetical protein